MKKALLIFVACFAGVLAALQLNSWIQGKKEPTTKVMWAKPDGRLVANEEQLGTGIADFRGAAKRILPAVVSIDAVGLQENFFGVEQVADSGSGVVISADGYVVTNAHVVQPGDTTKEINVHLSDGKTIPAKVIGVDPMADLAVLRVNASNLQPAKLGSSSGLEVGQWVLAVGNPFQQDNTVSVGIVGNIGRDVQVDRGKWLINTIQTDASINPGNSGGALTNAAGELIGINTAILSPGRSGSVGIGYAIPIDHAKPIIEDLIKYGKSRYGSLGIQVAARPGLLQIPQAREQYKQETGFDAPESGALVISVENGSAAKTSGLAILDVIVEVNGQSIEGRDDFIRETYGTRPNDKVKVRVFQRGKIVEKVLTALDIANL